MKLISVRIIKEVTIIYCKSFSPTVLEIVTPDVTVNEGGGTAEVCVELINEIEGSLSLTYATGDVHNGATGRVVIVGASVSEYHLVESMAMLSQ